MWVITKTEDRFLGCVMRWDGMGWDWFAAEFAVSSRLGPHSTRAREGAVVGVDVMLGRKRRWEATASRPLFRSSNVWWLIDEEEAMKHALSTTSHTATSPLTSNWSLALAYRHYVPSCSCLRWALHA